MVAFNRLFEDEEGVSEVVGTILTLGITVVLFSSVYAGVSTLDSPERRDHLEMDVVYEPYNLTISHQGGKTLEIDNLEFTVLSEGETFRYTTEDDELSGPRGDEWSVGQTVNLDLSDESGELGSDMELVIQNQDSNRVIYQTDVSMQELGRADINNAYIRYIHDWRNYAEQGEEIDIVAELSNIEGIDDNEINVNVSVSDGQLWADHEEGENISLERASGNKYENRSIQISPVAEEDRYSIKIVADIAGNESEEWVRLNVGKKPAEENPKELEIGRIDYTPSFPSHGEDITITAEVFNHGPENFTTEWSMFDSFKEDEEEVANDTDVTISAGPAPTEISGEFEIRGSGTHGIRVKVDGNEEWDGAEKSFELTVDPHVLVVEDRSADQLPEAELMSNALSGLNLDHQVKSVESADDVSEINFKDHSIIVWMSGNETGDGEEEDTTLLENSDVADDLTSYVDNERGNLWVLGVNLDDVYDGNGADLNNYLGGIDWNDNEEDSTTSVRGANETGPFFREPIFDLNPVDYSDGQSQIDYHEMDLSNSDSLNKLVEVDDEGDDTETYFGGGYDQFDNDQRTVTNSFLFDMIQDPGLRTAVAGEVIGWATNISVRSGVDVAVTSQNIEPSSPMYLDTINITATFRNNGPRDLTLNNTARLVRSDGEEVISPPDDANLFLEANGGTAEVTFEWTADELGVHKFLVKADYIGEIDQANPETNDITYKNLDITDDEIYANVHYSTMVVDADLSNDKDFYDTAGEVTDAFDRLGHEEGSDYEVYDVGMDENEIEDGPSASNMSNFNSVFWITGERGEADDAQPIFTDADISNINDYLNQSGGGNMLFMGEHMLDFLNENNEDDLIEMMGVDPNNIDDRKETDVLKGLENNPVGHGLRYELGSDLNYTTFETDDDGDVIFQGSGGQNLSSTYDDGNVKTIYMGVDIERIEGPMLSDGAFSDWPAGDVNTSKESARTEFVYGSIWNFGKSGETIEVDGEVTPEGRTELRVSDYDIRLNTDRPHTGRSYEVRAEIENIGYRGASTLVRFYDGEDYIGAENLFVEGSERESEPGSSYFEVESGTATAEVSWSPSHPGPRDLIVEVDPEREVDEIQDEDGNKIMELNNRAEIEQPVYFFYDDMEEGEQKWRHDETLVNIDGSGPLDFADRRDMETNVEGDWDHEKSGMTYEDGSSEFGDGYYETDDEDVEDFTDKAHYSS
ncbi:MAG: CARDB domain-containing protein, partial [Thermoplasmata archaeon]